MVVLKKKIWATCTRARTSTHRHISFLSRRISRPQTRNTAPLSQLQSWAAAHQSGQERGPVEQLRYNLPSMFPPPACHIRNRSKFSQSRQFVCHRTRRFLLRPIKLDNSPGVHLTKQASSSICSASAQVKCQETREAVHHTTDVSKPTVLKV